MEIWYKPTTPGSVVFNGRESHLFGTPIYKIAWGYELAGVNVTLSDAIAMAVERMPDVFIRGFLKDYLADPEHQDLAYADAKRMLHWQFILREFAIPQNHECARTFALKLEILLNPGYLDMLEYAERASRVFPISLTKYKWYQCVPTPECILEDMQRGSPDKMKALMDFGLALSAMSPKELALVGQALRCAGADEGAVSNLLKIFTDSAVVVGSLAGALQRLQTTAELAQRIAPFVDEEELVA
jgi:hypothetical protein